MDTSQPATASLPPLYGVAGSSPPHAGLASSVAHTLQPPQSRRQYSEHGRPPLRRASYSAPAHFGAQDKDQTLELYSLGSNLTSMSAMPLGMSPGGLHASLPATFSEAVQPKSTGMLDSFGPGSVP